MGHTVRPFRDRLREAANYAGVEYSQTTIARALGVSKQAVDRWFGDGEPRPAMIFRIADLWNVDARWLATEEGKMVSPPPPGNGLSRDEHALVRRHRAGSPQMRAALKVMLKIALLLCFILPPPQDANAIGHNAFHRDVLSAKCLSFYTLCKNWLIRVIGHFSAQVRTV